MSRSVAVPNLALLLFSPASAFVAFATTPSFCLQLRVLLPQQRTGRLVVSKLSFHHRRLVEPSSNIWNSNELCRRHMLHLFSFCFLSSWLVKPLEASAATSKGGSNHPFVYSDEWTGTNLPLQTLEEAVETAAKSSNSSWPMARWPDVILRRPASPVQNRWYGTTILKQACSLLQETATNAGAVGLAAQQSGVDARIIYLETPGRIPSSIVMINPHIVQRSAEEDMRVWQEHCLVLPPTFIATVLRDAWVDVEYWDWKGKFHAVRLAGEIARAAQHELDHDRGILTLDHVGLEELESDVMRRIEEPGHWDRMKAAYSRVVEPRFELRQEI